MSKSSGTSPALEAALAAEYQLTLPIGEWLKAEPNLSDDDIAGRIAEGSRRSATPPRSSWCGAETFHHFERNVMLQSLDTHWREHLAALDHLRQGIHLRGYAQKNPKQEYKREAFELFEGLLQTVRNEVTKLLMTVEIRSQEQIEETRTAAGGGERAIPPRRFRRGAWRVGRSGKTGPAPSAPGTRKSAATIPAPAVRARSTSTVTAN